MLRYRIDPGLCLWPRGPGGSFGYGGRRIHVAIMHDVTYELQHQMCEDDRCRTTPVPRLSPAYPFSVLSLLRSPLPCPRPSPVCTPPRSAAPGPRPHKA
eukprot:4867518-Prymnesium_polylepis.2